MASSIFVTPLGPMTTIQGLIVNQLPSGGYAPIEVHAFFSNGMDLYTHSDTAFRGPTIDLFKSRGTQAVPTTVSSGDNLGYINIGGYDGAAYAAPVSVTSKATETWSSTAHGSNIVFSVCQNTTTSQLIAMLIQSTGNVGFGSAITNPSATIHIKAGTTAASTSPLKFTSGALMTSAEAGAHEFLTDDYYLTITTGTARKGIVLNDGSNLTSGKIPIASTNGRLIDGQTPLAGTKVYWVSDTSGGAVNRKLTFTAGILTAET